MNTPPGTRVADVPIRCPVARPFRIVVVAASAGGVEAISCVLSRLPASYPLAIAIVQHRSASSPSLLAKILRGRTKLKVKDAEEGDEICAGVYVARPGLHLIIDANERFSLVDGAKVKHVRPSGDVLFASAASAFGPQVIALVLTGGDGDGSDGIRIVKEGGGTVISQDEASSQASGMPRSAIATGDVDYVVTLTEIALILEILAATGVERSEDLDA